MKPDDFNNTVHSLIAQTKVGREAAFDEIADRYGPLIDSLARKYAPCDKIEEFQQEALIALYQAACTYDSNVQGVSFGLYAKVCIKNSLITYSRSESRQRLICSDTEEIDKQLIYSDDPIEDCINRENFLNLDRFVRSQLSDYEYSVYRMYIEGYRIKEIAAHFSRSEKSVEGAILRLKMKLRSNFIKNDL